MKEDVQRFGILHGGKSDGEIFEVEIYFTAIVTIACERYEKTDKLDANGLIIYTLVDKSDVPKPDAPN